MPIATISTLQTPSIHPIPRTAAVWGTQVKTQSGNFSTAVASGNIWEPPPVPFGSSGTRSSPKLALGLPQQPAERATFLQPAFIPPPQTHSRCSWLPLVLLALQSEDQRAAPAALKDTDAEILEIHWEIPVLS